MPSKAKKSKDSKSKENTLNDQENARSSRKPKRMEKLRKKQSLLRMVHTGQGQIISSGPLTPIIDESPRNSLILSSNSNSAASTPVSIKPMNWNKSDSEVKFVILTS